MKFKRSPIAMAELVAAGVGDAECDAWVRYGVGSWLKSDGALPLQRFMGLPESPERLRVQIRDTHLLVALELLDGDLWTRAKTLARLVCEFESRRWPAWRDMRTPPGHASRVDLCLFYALRAHASRMPRTAQGVLRIANKTGEKS